MFLVCQGSGTSELWAEAAARWWARWSRPFASSAATKAVKEPRSAAWNATYGRSRSSPAPAFRCS